MRNIKHVGFVIKPHAPEAEKALGDLIRYFEQKSIECHFEEAAAEKIGLQNGVKREEIPAQVDLVIVLGGDGTLLTIAHLAAQEKIPVLGVNLGSLGFLTEVPLNEVFLTLDALLEGNTKIVTQRRLLDVIYRGETLPCLNDVVINKGALARMIQAKIWIDDKEIVIPRADGLIISTPTGSTAYSLSAGGPIIQPYIPAIILAPICPHTLSFRPMVISSSSIIKLQLVAGEEAYLTLDGQRGDKMNIDDIIEVRTSSLEFTLVSSPKRNYFDLLQEKLSWG
ncbi:NAD(+)/NADH kinase [Acidobacteriota bacterium]